MNFSDRLAKQILKKKNPSVLGLDQGWSIYLNPLKQKPSTNIPAL